MSMSKETAEKVLKLTEGADLRKAVALVQKALKVKSSTAATYLYAARRSAVTPVIKPRKGVRFKTRSVKGVHVKTTVGEASVSYRPAMTDNPPMPCNTALIVDGPYDARLAFDNGRIADAVVVRRSYLEALDSRLVKQIAALTELQRACSELLA